MDGMERCAVVVLNWNGEDMLKAYLPTLVKYTQVEGVVLVVADNASTDGSVDYIAAHFPEVKIINIDKNRGFAGGYNYALNQILANYYVLLNSDIEVTEGWILPLLEKMDAEKDLWACVPKLLSIKERECFEYAGASGGFIDVLGYPYCRGRVFETVERDEGQYDDERDVFWGTGAALMIRGWAFLDLGGFDEDYFAHMEEIDLCWRIGNAGGRIAVVPKSVVYHWGGGSLESSSPYKTYLNFRNNLATVYKNTLTYHIVWILALRIVLDVLAASMFFCKGEFAQAGAALKGHWHFWKRIDKHKRKRDINRNSAVILNAPYILKGSIVWKHYIMRRNKYSKL